MILPTTVTRQSVCELEVDAVAADILNRKQTGKGQCVYRIVTRNATNDI